MTGEAEVATELMLDVDEFDTYDVALPPVTIGFFQREFNVCSLARLTILDLN